MDDGPEPLEVLEKLLGTKASATPAGNQAGARITEEDLLGEFDFGGKSLRELALSDDVDVIAAEPYRHQSVEECT